MSPDNTRPELHQPDLAERRSDQGVWNDYMADAAETGVYPGSEDKVLPSGANPKRSHASRRGGRSHPEITGGDVSRNLANADAETNPMSVEDRQAAAKKGAAALESWRKQNEIDRAMRRVDEGTRDDPYYRDKVEASRQRAQNAAMQTISDRRTD